MAKWLIVGSPEYNTLMDKWRDEAWKEETASDYEEHLSNKDMQGRLESKLSTGGLSNDRTTEYSGVK